MRRPAMVRPEWSCRRRPGMRPPWFDVSSQSPLGPTRGLDPRVLHRSSTASRDRLPMLSKAESGCFGKHCHRHGHGVMGWEPGDL